MPRLFLAIPLPDDLRREIASQRVVADGCRWVPECNLHVTLHFLGNTRKQALEIIRSLLGGVRAVPVRCRLSRLVALPGGRRPRVLALMCEPNQALSELREKTGRILSTQDIETDSRPFRPHVTVARLTRPDPLWLGEYVQTRSATMAAEFLARSYVLYESVTRPSGAVYTALETYELRVEA